MGKVAFVFPGQGAQFVGMGKDFYEEFSICREVFEDANESLGIDIKSVCFEGPEEELIRTENTQPAILATSIAILRALEERGINCDYAAGLSLGEYTALVEAEAFEFCDAVHLVKNRGRYMQEAVPEGKGGMAAILGLEKSKLMKAVEKAKDYGVVEIANYNSPEQIVISGEVEPLEIAVNESKELGAKKAVKLPVSAPFHSSLLKPAGDKLEKDLDKVKINDLKKVVISNVAAKPVKTREEVRSNLIRQVSNSVLWCDSIIYMMDNEVDTFIEIGPGKSLKGFIKRIAKSLNKKVNTFSVNSISEFEKVCDFFNREV
ncbi:ACP S-malonyltransferase [Anaerosalibacter massiliensis]|uniref:Malonyl CoA-acyl carrier protein transacylase n=1 Tax=Anaerosalibacter massiliensis TaxID=1347392 RepID=A0A9X2MGW0_9FIRM|nr:ACP S-malonyltransferase [Anaerosalibacter massiliensis]MCR2043316.1 ACP S-malonyltransferase [Anaerosalibacter massiliensis]